MCFVITKNIKAKRFLSLGGWGGGGGGEVLIGKTLSRLCRDPA